MEKNILVAVDGSTSTGSSLDYLAQLFAHDSELTIHLLSVIPSGGGGKDWMLEVDPLRAESAGSDKRTVAARKHLKDAEERLLRSGFAKKQIQVKTKTATSISNAIREEAERGHFDSVLIGRRGLGSVGSMFFGSTSGDLVEKCHRVPLWIVDGKVRALRFLLAVQSHPASLMAADHLAFMLKNHTTADICLYHSNAVFGSQQVARPEDFHAQWGKSWCDKYLDIDNFLFYAHAQLLVDNDISRHRISQLPAQMHLDVGTDLLRQAKQHQCGTIVIGRRRRSLTGGHLKGVSDKTLRQAQNIAIWLAG